MTDVSSLHRLPVGASAQFLREAEIRRGIELLYFGYSNMVKGADVHLAAQGLGRAAPVYREVKRQGRKSEIEAVS